LASLQPHPPHRISGLLDDGVLLLVVVFVFPLLILLAGGMVGLVVRLVMEIAHRLG
jgi:hypothetical protein